VFSVSEQHVGRATPTLATSGALSGNRDRSDHRSDDEDAGRFDDACP